MSAYHKKMNGLGSSGLKSGIPSVQGLRHKNGTATLKERFAKQQERERKKEERLKAGIKPKPVKPAQVRSARTLASQEQQKQQDIYSSSSSSSSSSSKNLKRTHAEPIGRSAGLPPHKIRKVQPLNRGRPPPKMKEEVSDDEDDKMSEDEVDEEGHANFMREIDSLGRDELRWLIKETSKAEMDKKRRK